MSMTDSSSISFSNIKTKGSDFTFTGKLSDYVKNDTWVSAYNEIANGEGNGTGLSTLWKALSAGTEDAGNKIYCTILNYIDKLGNIDTCELKSLKEYSNMVGGNYDLLNVNIDFPIEIEQLINTLSINRAYLYNKHIHSINEDDTETDIPLTVENTILHSSTIEEIESYLGNIDKFKEIIHNCIYNTIMEFLNLKNTTFDDSARGIETKEIWKVDTQRFTDNLWVDDVDSDNEVFELKKSLSVNKQFTEKIYADDIIAGKRSLNEFTDAQQIVIKKEIEKRKNRYNDSNSMKYYYMRMYKVLEYFRFCSTLYNTVYKLESYDLDDNKYIINSAYSEEDVLVYNYDQYEINTSLIHKVTDWITDYIIEISKLRTNMRSQCQKNTMAGTKRLLIDLIRKFILDNIGSDVWNTAKNSIFKRAMLNTNFDVSMVQYIDTTDYTNIENKNDSVSPTEHTLNPRYWENYNDLNNAISNDEILDFFNRLNDDGYKFKYNRDDGLDSSFNLYEFLSVLFETGATNNTTSDYVLSSDIYMSVDGNKIKCIENKELDDDAKEVIAKYSGDSNIGDTPYANIKNSFHPSRELMPFIQAFEEYTEVYTMISNIVTAYTESVDDSIKRLKLRLDSIGNTINFWNKWNDDFTGYSTNDENRQTDNILTDFCDSPYNFDALYTYLNQKDNFINDLIDGKNKYYIDENTNKSVIDNNDKILEISRLQNYYEKIKSNSNREIYAYGKDYNGNIYILYKNKGNRRNKYALGDIWVRLKNHPIAFPLFDINLSKNGFNSISVLNETNNTKLIDVLNEVVAFFKETYGKHNQVSSTVNDGDIIMNNIGLTYGNYSNTLPILHEVGSKSLTSDPFYGFNYKEDFDIENNNLKLIRVIGGDFNDVIMDMDYKSLKKAEDDERMKDYIDTIYYIDSVTNEVVKSGSDSDCEIYCEENGKYTKIDKNDGKIILTPEADWFSAEYDNENKTFAISSNVINDYGDILLFSDFDDINVVEEGKTYYCKNTTSDGKMHPCTKHSIHINSLYKLSSNALSGNVDSSGNIHFGGDMLYDKQEQTNVFSTYTKTISSVEDSTSVDGSVVYEDFSTYKYKIADGTSIDLNSIVFLGGNNPYYVSYDDILNKLELIKAYFVNDELEVEENHYEFGDNVYREKVSSEWLSSYPVSDCVFYRSDLDSSTQNDAKSGAFVDTIGQFTLKENPYKFYYPYTAIDGVPYELGTDTSAPTAAPYGTITITDKKDNVHTFFYTLSAVGETDGVKKYIRTKRMIFDRKYETLESSVVKLNGEIKLTSVDSTDYPIYLTLNSEDENNVAKHSDIVSIQNQNKFFDFGFSYNQKMFYASYFNASNTYLDSGTIVGRFSETYDSEYNKKLVFYRDSSKNVEFFDAESVGYEQDSSKSVSFHIGNCSSRNGVITVYGRKFNPTNSDGGENIEIIINLVTDSNVYKYKYSIPLKFGLYEFDKGEIYSFSVSCTFDRLYISFVTNPPGDDDIVSTTIDRNAIGKSGSTKFSDFENYDIDSTITILSFDISDNTNFIYKDDETRYLMECGTHGYFNQFGGFDGKNNIFANEKLSSDVEFGFYPCFKDLTADSESINFYTEYTTNISGDYLSDISEPNGRFINIYSSDDSSLSGIVISDNSKYAYMCIASESGGTSIKFTNFDGKSIYDVSRGIGNGIMFFADGDDTDTKLGAFFNNTSSTGYKDVNGYKLVKIPLHTELSGYYNTDFIELNDVGSDVYAFCSDRHTVVKTSVHSRDNSFVPTSGIIKYDLDRTSSSIISGCEMKNEDVVIYLRTYDPIQTDSYSRSSVRGHQNADYVINEDYITFFGVYDNKTITIKAATKINNSINYPVIPFFIRTKTTSSKTLMEYTYEIPYVFEYFETVELNGVRTVKYYIYKINENGAKEYVYNKYNEYHVISFNYDDPIKNVINTTKGSDIKFICTEKGGTYEYTLRNDETIIASTFEGIREEIELEKYSMEANVHEASEHILISYYVEDTKRGGLLWTRKDSPENVGVKCEIHGINESSSDEDILTHVNIKNILSIDNIVLIDDSISGLIYRSTDDGLTFHVLTESVAYKMKLVGCSTSRFYARYVNNEKASSTDGETWKNVIDIPFSDWNILNATYNDGTTIKINDYIACEKYDVDLKNDIVERNYYIRIDKSKTIDDFTYDGFKLHNGVNLLYGGMDGTTPIHISRSSEFDGEFKTYEFEYSVGFTYNNVGINGNDLYFAPDNGTKVLVIRNAFDISEEPTNEIIDLSNATNNTINSFSGFEINCGRFMMFPEVGDRILTYNDNLKSFYNFYSFGSTMYFSDMDSIDGSDESESFITSRYIESDGTIRFYKTRFTNDNSYGIVEIDEGFPILVTYGKYNTKFSYGGEEYPIYSLTFTFINDYNRRSVYILSKPILDENEVEYAKEIIEYEGSKTALYVSGDSSICYNFSTVDDTGKYKIKKIYKRNSVTKEDVDYLTVTYGVQSIEDRNKIYFDYTLAPYSDGSVSIYKDFSNSEFNVILKNISAEGKTSFKINISESELKNVGHVDFYLTAAFSTQSLTSDCVIYWGDGEVYDKNIENVITYDIKEGYTTRDNTFHFYKHSYYSSGEHTVVIGDGLITFRCGRDIDGYTDTIEDRSKEYVVQALCYSDSENLVSAKRSYASCINMDGPLPKWGAHITNAVETYFDCKSISTSAVPSWNDSMTDIRDCYNGCVNIGMQKE